VTAIDGRSERDQRVEYVSYEEVNGGTRTIRQGWNEYKWGFHRDVNVDQSVDKE
jgi:hypothetical protein